MTELQNGVRAWRGAEDDRYKKWHRERLGSAFVMVDVDAVELCHRCLAPLDLQEVAGWDGDSRENVHKGLQLDVLRQLASANRTRAHLIEPAFNADGQLKMVRVTDLLGQTPEMRTPIVMLPTRYRAFLQSLRDQHRRQCTAVRR
jgi:hypothetical protein